MINVLYLFFGGLGWVGVKVLICEVMIYFVNMFVSVHFSATSCN